MTNRTVRGRRRNPKAPRSYLNNMRHYVYRHFDENGQPLYVGCSTDVQTRFKSHMFQRTWWAQLVTNTKITVHPNKKKGWEVEKQEIARLEPLHNGEVQLMDTAQWSYTKFIQHGRSLAQGHWLSEVTPTSALGKLAKRFGEKFELNLLEEMGPVSSGFRNMDPNEDRPLRILELEKPNLPSGEVLLPPLLKAV